MVVKSNISAANSNRMLGLVTGSQAKSTEKLSSGYRINRAADDAAGLAISEKMRRQIRGLTQASANAQDGISFVQIADGALDEVHDMLNRSEELAVKAANGSLTDTDRSYIQSEIDGITAEIDKIASITNFNEIEIFPKNGHSPEDAISAMNALSDQLSKLNVVWNFIDSAGNKVNPADAKAIGYDTTYATSDMAGFVQTAADDAVAKIKAAFPTLYSTAASSPVKVGLDLSNIDGKSKTLAQAELSMSYNSTSTQMSYTLHVDTSDYPIDGFASQTDAKKADLAETIAHEMTHIMMYDTTTGGMLSKSGTSFPLWFIEGTAQAIAGADSWVNGYVNSSSSDADIKAYMAQINTMPYGAGYMGSMYLGYEAGGGAASGKSMQDTIKDGLDKILTATTNNGSLSDAIAANTSFSGLSDFENSFKNGSSDALTFVKNLLTARGADGVGSLIAPSLGTSKADAFGPAKLTQSGGNYIVNKDNTQYWNAFGSGYTAPEKKPGTTDSVDGGGDIILQVGSERGHQLDVMRFNISSQMLFGIGGMDVTRQETALATIDKIKDAGRQISSIRSYYGASQNRLEHTVNNLDNVIENTTSAESRIRDTDMATEMVKFSNNNILSQAGQAMLAQANQSNQGVLSLLQ